MASNTQGIQQLLAAEKKAADKVGDARKRKLIDRNNFDFFWKNENIFVEKFHHKIRSCEFICFYKEVT